jgi:hypothetical protein
LSERLRALDRGQAAIVAALSVTALFLLAQIVLPDLAERRIRSMLDERAQVERVHVEAFPAVKLLWRHADRIELRLGELRAGTGRLAGLVDDAGGVAEVHAEVRIVRAETVVLRDASLRKQGDRLVGRARVTEQDVRTALGGNLGLRPVGVEDGTLVVRGGIRALGQVVGVSARVVADAGGVVVQPQGIPFIGGLVQVTVFNDPRLSVDSLTARQVRNGYALTATGRLT